MNDLPTIIHPNELRNPKRLDYDWDPRAIEFLADKLHRCVESELGETLPRDSILAIRLLGYVVERHGELPELVGEGGRSRVAGFIEDKHQVVGYSDSFPKETRLFTLTHELGHLLLHHPVPYHRDRPLDAGRRLGKRNRKEWEADQFAKYYLMPAKLVRKYFLETFDDDGLSLHEGTSAALYQASLSDVRTVWTNRRNGARMVASAKRFNGHPIIPLHSIFGVSIEAMAIRLEELDLIDDD